MFEDCRGRLARSLQEAEDYILDFIVENLAQRERRIVEKSHDYDLYLPWLMEIVENQRITVEEHCPEIVELECLYMDAAWSLCNKGYLRPGPRRTNSENARDGFGKGYSLTLMGRTMLRERVWQMEAVGFKLSDPEDL
ncbi:MAG TPA: hypothetical protein VJ835_09460 [Fimbriimonadaceae bacterium]|jgi:hypothetical protein|nr:hypothetical protein [Fimbriimonadaceae bacterium]